VEAAKNGQTNFTVIDDTFTGKTIDISCSKVKAEILQA